jgi:hypothetical protein
MGKRDRILDWAKVDALCDGIGELAVIDTREPDEILGYDTFGIPR